MIKIMFSLLIHEQPSVVIDQLINLYHYNKNIGVVIHINPEMKFPEDELTIEQFQEKLGSFPNVFINEERLKVGFADLIQAHLSNFKYVGGIEYEYFYLISSNEMFVKSGLEDFISEYEYGCEALDKSNWHYFESMQKDCDLKKIIEDCGGTRYFYSQIEGTFYKKHLFAIMRQTIDKYYDYRNQEEKYPREEVYFPTVANILFKDLRHYDKCCCKIRWQGKILFTSIKSIKRIVKNDNLKYFSVKRVDRQIDNYLRCYIRDYLGCYHNELERLLGKSIKSKSKLTINLCNLRYLIIYFFRDKLARLYRFVFRKK